MSIVDKKLFFLVEITYCSAFKKFFFNMYSSLKYTNLLD